MTTTQTRAHVADGFKFTLNPGDSYNCVTNKWYV